MATAVQPVVPDPHAGQEKSEIRQLVDSLDDDKEGVSVQTHIYQAARLRALGKEEEDGFCDGVATEWLRLNLQQKPELFQSMVESDFAKFGEVKDKIKLKKAQFNITLQRLDSERGEIERKNDIASRARRHLDDARYPVQKAEDVGKPKPPAARIDDQMLKDLDILHLGDLVPHRDPNMKDEDWDKLLEQRAVAIDQKVVELLGAINANHRGVEQVGQQQLAAYSDLVHGQGGQSLHEVGKGDGTALKDALKRQLLNNPGYYLVYISKDGKSGGHTVGFHIGDHPRFLDANSGEIQFRDRQAMNRFLDQYWPRVYGKHVGRFHVYSDRQPPPPPVPQPGILDSVKSAAEAAWTGIKARFW